MDWINLPATVLGVFAGLLTMGMLLGAVRPSLQVLTALVKLGVVTLLADLTCCQPLALTLAGLAAFCLFSQLPSPRFPAHGKAVFVTGCDRGLGQQLAIYLDSLGMRVFAGCLFPGGEGEVALKSKCSQRLRTIPLDVSDVAAVKAAADTVKADLQGGELWGVVNNAGICYIGCLEIMSETDIRRLVEVNFMGQVNVIRAFLPLLRHSRGRLVNVASNTGLAPVPFYGAYCASKSAVAALTGSLRIELSTLGIKVSTIIPSGYRTGIQQYDVKAAGDRWWGEASKEVQNSYGRDSFYPENKTKNYKDMLNPDFSGIVHKMADALLEKRPKAYYFKGLLARSLPFIHDTIPTCIADLFYPAFVSWYKFDPPCLLKQNGDRKDQ